MSEFCPPLFESVLLTLLDTTQTKVIKHSPEKPVQPVPLLVICRVRATEASQEFWRHLREKYNFQTMIRHCVRSIADVIGHSNIVLHLRYVRSLLAHLRLILFFDML